MKIAVASEKGMVTGHFGHCENFMVFNAEDNKIVGTESVPNPGHKPGFLPNYLNDMGVNVIISGEIDVFSERTVTITFVSASLQETVNA